MADATPGTPDKLAQTLFFLLIAGTVAFVGAVFAFVL
jgi:hypothetical protein